MLFNRFYEPDINIDKLEMSSSDVFSSPEDIRRSMRWVGLISSQVPNVEVAAGTGIHDSEAVIKQLLAGAQVTQISSSVYINGSQIIAGMIIDLTEFMKKQHFTKIEDFPKVLKDAVIAAEDKRFYEHWGVDVIGVARAVVGNLVAGGVQSGECRSRQAQQRPSRSTRRRPAPSPQGCGRPRERREDRTRDRDAHG